MLIRSLNPTPESSLVLWQGPLHRVQAWVWILHVMASLLPWQKQVTHVAGCSRSLVLGKLQLQWLSYLHAEDVQFATSDLAKVWRVVASLDLYVFQFIQ